MMPPVVEPIGAAPAPHYAVVFRTHFWDDFTRRQLDRLKRRTTADIFVLVDETKGPVAGVEHDRVIRVTGELVLKAGYAAAGEGALLWFNGDYPLYHFRTLQPTYHYYLQLEYDVVLNLDLDGLMAQVAEDQADLVALTKGDPPSQWYWRRTLLEAYEADEIRFQLICVSIFSGRALDHLSRRRLALSDDYSAGRLSTWPFCEGFIATEMARSDLKVRELSAYGPTDGYDFWPPFVEADLDGLANLPFIHPVLDRDRYVDSILKYTVGIRDFINPASLMHRKMRRLGPSGYLAVLTSAKMTAAARHALQRKIPQQPGARTRA